MSEEETEESLATLLAYLKTYFEHLRDNYTSPEWRDKNHQVVVTLDRAIALEAENAKLRKTIAAVEAVLAYDSEAHHEDAPCTDACMDGFRGRLRAALAESKPENI